MDFLVAIEQLGAVRLLKGSYYAYPIVNALHIASIGVLLTSVWLMDLRVLGWLRSLPETVFLRLLRRVALAAFLCAVVTGLLLFSVRASEYATLPVFLAKMALIVLAALNLVLFIVLGRNRPEGQAPDRGERAAALASALLWTGVLFAGRFIGFA
ncbi:hypothetical protein RB623_23840 [Mesorhizobium sp. LHD-90]|uniref:DUF6644 family protein n=1 Tax=Mesorhizobium sp. LHD-90 TaxID=3071414 RepID=UPI0027DFC019|nr:DUF6644 family protein [Mesorhizobium sp. LHD-90]MDQ6437096.1 hypothetical protein [Mesorhizobium sp. LHD-90]